MSKITSRRSDLVDIIPLLPAAGYRRQLNVLQPFLFSIVKPEIIGRIALKCEGAQERELYCPFVNLTQGATGLAMIDLITRCQTHKDPPVATYEFQVSFGLSFCSFNSGFATDETQFLLGVTTRLVIVNHCARLAAHVSACQKLFRSRPGLGHQTSLSRRVSCPKSRPKLQVTGHCWSTKSCYSRFKIS